MAGLFLLGLAPRLYALGARSLWLDEAGSEGISTLPWHQFWLLLSRHEANMGLYYLLLRGWLRLGSSDLWLRLPSAIFGALAVVVGYAMLRRSFGRWAAVGGAILLAFNPFAINYSQDARSYSLAMLLVMLSAWFLWQAVERRRGRFWLGFDLAAIAAVYAHFFAGLALAAELGFLLWQRLDRRFWKTAAAHAALVAAAASPLALFVLRRNDGQLFWVPPLAPHILGTILGNFAGVFLRSQWQFWPLVLLVYGLAGFAGLAILRPRLLTRRPGRDLSARRLLATDPLDIRRPAQRRLLRLLVFWLFIPVLSCLAVSVWQRVLVNRFLVVAMPPLPLLAGIGAAKLRRPLGILACGLALALSISVLAGFYHKPHEDWRGAAAWLAHHSRPGDVLLVYGPYCALPLEHYLRRLPRAPLLLYPPSVNAYHLLSLRHGELSARYGGMASLGYAISELHARRGRVWVAGLGFYDHFNLNGVTMKFFRQAGWPAWLRLRLGRHFKGVDIARFDPIPRSRTADVVR